MECAVKGPSGWVPASRCDAPAARPKSVAARAKREQNCAGKFRTFFAFIIFYLYKIANSSSVYAARGETIVF